jgi:hypothetical protein
MASCALPTCITFAFHDCRPGALGLGGQLKPAAGNARLFQEASRALPHLWSFGAKRRAGITATGPVPRSLRRRDRA